MTMISFLRHRESRGSRIVFSTVTSMRNGSFFVRNFTTGAATVEWKPHWSETTSFRSAEVGVTTSETSLQHAEPVTTGKVLARLPKLVCRSHGHVPAIAAHRGTETCPCIAKERPMCGRQDCWHFGFAQADCDLCHKTGQVQAHRGIERYDD